MTDINHFVGIVKILENPTRNLFITDNLMSNLRVQLPQTRNAQIVNLVFWGNLALDIITYYKADDYLIIEGYLAIPNKLNSKQVEITVLKVYPFIIDYTLDLIRK
jgi:hypothetical protein